LNEWLPYFGVFLVLDGIISIIVHYDGLMLEHFFRAVRALIGVVLIVAF